MASDLTAQPEVDTLYVPVGRKQCFRYVVFSTPDLFMFPEVYQSIYLLTLGFIPKYNGRGLTLHFSMYFGLTKICSIVIGEGDVINYSNPCDCYMITCCFKVVRLFN